MWFQLAKIWLTSHMKYVDRHGPNLLRVLGRSPLGGGFERAVRPSGR